MKRLLPAYIVLTALSAQAKPDPDPLKLAQVYAAMPLKGVDFKVYWKSCGDINAFYDDNTHEVTLCSELHVLGAPVIRVILAHELAHAVVLQRDIPYTGNHEVAADELAAVMLSAAGMENDVLAAAAFFESRGSDMPAWEDHPDSDERGYALHVIAMGHKLGTRHYARPADAWARLLAK